MRNGIKAERHSRGWNQTTLAAHVGVSQGDISKFETGRAIPTPAQAERLSRILGLPIDALLREVRDPREPREPVSIAESGRG